MDLLNELNESKGKKNFERKKGQKKNGGGKVLPFGFSLFRQIPCPKSVSPAWIHFSYLVLNQSQKTIKNVVSCNECKKESQVLKLYAAQTASVQRHLEKAHSIVYPVKRNAATLNKKEGHDALLKWILRKQVPLNLILNPDFEFFVSMISSYEVN